MKINNSYCPAPWKSVLISPNGKIYTCYEASDCLGEINEIPLADILNSYKSKLIKEKMSKDEIVPQCEFCILKENTIESRRNACEEERQKLYKNPKTTSSFALSGSVPSIDKPKELAKNSDSMSSIV